MKHQKSTSSLLINESPLLVLPSLAVKAGLNEALILQQVHYWISNPKAGIDHEGRRWVWNTIKDWKEQFPFWSEKTISRAMHSARQQGFLLCEKLSKDSWDKTMHYSLDYDALNSGNAPKSLIHSIGTDCPNRYGQSDRIDRDRLTASIGTDCPHLYSTETSSETSSETTHKEKQNEAKASSMSVGEVVDLYHEILPSLPSVLKVTDARRKAISARIHDDLKTPSEWRVFFSRVGKSDFLTGKADNFRADLEWLCKPSNFLKVREGRYDPKNATSATTERSSGINNPPPPRYLN